MEHSSLIVTLRPKKASQFSQQPLEQSSRGHAPKMEESLSPLPTEESQEEQNQRERTHLHLSSPNGDQILVFETKKGYFRVYLKGNYRCEKCIKQADNCCIILLNPTLVVVRCITCHSSKGVHGCKPNLDILKQHFPDNSQIIASEERIERYNRKMNRSGSSTNTIQVANSRPKRFYKSTFEQSKKVIPLTGNRKKKQKFARKPKTNSSRSQNQIEVDRTENSNVSMAKSSSVSVLSEVSHCTSEPSKSMASNPIQQSTPSTLLESPKSLNQNKQFQRCICDIEQMLKCQADNNAKVELTLMSVRALLRDLKQ